LRRIGINAVFLEPQMGGIETYVRRLVPALLEAAPELQLDLFLNESGRSAVAKEPWAADVRLVTHPLLGRRFTRALSELTVLGAIASRQGLDVLHSVALTGPLRTKPAHVLTIPDVIWLHEPDPAELNTARLWRRIVPPVAKRANRILTYSEAAKYDVAASLGIDQDRIDAVPLGPGADAHAAPEPPALEGTIVLSVSALKVHKNLVPLVHAMKEVRETVPDAVLVIPGNPTPHGEKLRRLADRLGIGDALVLPGWTDAATLEGLYAAAACFVFPSVREGFGLPVLEAMRRGVPVACSRLSSLPEVAGDAALLFDPESASEIAAAIRRLIEDRALAEWLATAGRKRAATFTWRRTAEGTLESYERAMRARRDRAER
jgi:glycosyltransferase involved in cell wall biosynthesis